MTDPAKGWRGVALFAAAMLVALTTWSAVGRPGLSVIPFGVALAVALGRFLQKERSAVPALSRVHVRASARGLHVDRSRFLSNQDIGAVSVATRLGGFVVTVHGTWRTEELWFQARDEADALRLALGRANTRIELARHVSLLPALLAGGMLAALAIRSSHAWLTMLVVAAVVALPAVRRRRCTLTIGNDGVRIRGFRGSRLIPYAAIEHVERTSRAVRLRLRSDETLGVTSSPFPGATVGVRAVGGAIEHACSAWKERAAARTHTPLVYVPATADPTAVARYRVAAVPRERLLEAVEDTAAEIQVRVAAAEVLANDEDPVTQERLRHVMSATSSPELQRVLMRGR